MDKKQKNMDVARPNIQHQEETSKTSAIKRPVSQESDLKKVLKPEMLDL